jgi:hypothetical protein
VLDVAERIEHRVERARAEPVIEVLRESFKVDIGGIHRGEELRPRRLADIACRHSDSFHAGLPACGSNVDRVFEEDDRIVIGKGDRSRAAFDRRPRDRLRRSVALQPVVGAGFGDVPILAELAGEIAACGTEGEHGRSRQEVVKRLLFDGIEAEARRPPIGRKHDLVALARPDEAEPSLALMQPAFAGAEVALQTAVIEPVPVAARHRGAKFDVLHGRNMGRFSSESTADVCP